MDIYQQASAYADRIEQQLRELGLWQDAPLPESAYESDQAFLSDTMTFFQWLQFVLLVRIRETASERGTFPRESQVGAYATRELDGFAEGSDLIRLLCEFDDFIESRRVRRGGLHVVPAKPPEPVAEPVPEPPAEPAPTDSPLLVTMRYWDTRDASLLHRRPHARVGFDTGLAEQVFASAEAFLGFAGDPQEVAEGVMMRVMIHAARGPWVVLTLLSKDQGEWRVDLPLSLARTTEMFLRQHHIHPPYTETNDARGRAMQFWQHVANHDSRRAQELVIPESAEIPFFGTGQIDEFFWYISHTEDRDAANVEVLMNTQIESRTWVTRMVLRRGGWFVDLPATLIG